MIDILFEVIINTLVSSLVFAGIIMLFLLFLRKTSAATRFAFLTISVLLLLIIPAAIISLPSLKFSETSRLVIDRIDKANVSVVAHDERESPITAFSEITKDTESSLPAHKAPLPVNSNPWLDSILTHPQLPVISLTIWLSGFLISIGYNLAPRRYIKRIIRSSHQYQDTALTKLATHIQKSYRINRRIQIVTHHGISVPMVWGILKPVILLPSIYREWNDDKINAILHHEIAHIARYDNLIHLMISLVTALYWLNPLVWLIKKRIQIEREAACDDKALNHNIAPSQYAGYLLEIINSIQHRRIAYSPTALSYTTQTKERFMRILSPNTNRRPAKPLWIILASLITMGLALPATAVKPIEVIYASNIESEEDGESTISIKSRDKEATRITMEGDSKIYYTDSTSANNYLRQIITSDDNSARQIITSDDEVLFSSEYYKHLKEQYKQKQDKSIDELLKISEEHRRVAYANGSYAYLNNGNIRLIEVTIYDDSKDWELQAVNTILYEKDGKIKYDLLEPNSMVIIHKKTGNMKLQYIIGGDFYEPVFMIDKATYPFEERQWKEFNYMLKKIYNILK